jgi:AraC-like DNA-binding protein
MSLPASRTARPDNPQRRLLNSYELRLMCHDLVQRQGCDLEAILRGSGVTARQLENPAHRLTLEQELTIYTRVAGHNRDPLLGLHTGMRLSLPNYDMLGHAMMGAATIHDALLLLTEFAPLVSWASHSQLRSERLGEIDCKALTIFPTAADQRAAAREGESTFASLQTVFNDLAGEPVQFALVEMRHRSDAADLAPYRDLFHCPVAFGRERNALLIPRSLLTRRLPHPQPQYAGLFRELCRESMSVLAEDRGLIASIKSLLRAREGELPTLAQVAAHFHQSPRTLRRQLHSRGTSYQLLLDEVRFELASRYLVSTRSPVQAIARQLGYADARSFRTAFRRWAGRTPAEFRALTQIRSVESEREPN